MSSKMEQEMSSTQEVTPAQLPSTNPTSPSFEGESDLQFDTAVGMTLADAMREGSKETAQTYGWGDGIETACALTAAGIVVQRKGYR